MTHIADAGIQMPISATEKTVSAMARSVS